MLGWSTVSRRATSSMTSSLTVVVSGGRRRSGASNGASWRSRAAVHSVALVSAGRNPVNVSIATPAVEVNT